MFFQKLLLLSAVAMYTASATVYTLVPGQTMDYSLSSNDQLKWSFIRGDSEAFVLHVAWGSSQSGTWWMNYDRPADSSDWENSVDESGRNHAIVHSPCISDLSRRPEDYVSDLYFSFGGLSGTSSASVTLLKPDAWLDTVTGRSVLTTSIPSCVPSGWSFIYGFEGERYSYSVDVWSSTLPWNDLESVALQLSSYDDIYEDDWGGSCYTRKEWREYDYEDYSVTSKAPIIMTFNSNNYGTVPSTCEMLSVSLVVDADARSSAVVAFVMFGGVVAGTLCVLFAVSNPQGCGCASGKSYPGLVGMGRANPDYGGYPAPGGYAPVQPGSPRYEPPIPSYVAPSYATYDTSADHAAPPSYSDTMANASAPSQ